MTSVHFHRQIMLLAAALIVAQIMVRRKISVVGDSAVALLLGLIAGVFFFYLDLSATYLAWYVQAAMPKFCLPGGQRCVQLPSLCCQQDRFQPGLLLHRTAATDVSGALYTC